MASMGPGTTKELAERCVIVHRTAEKHTAEGLFEALPAAGVRGKRFLLPRAEEGREILPALISQEGGEVVSAVAYRNGLAEKDEAVAGEKEARKGLGSIHGSGQWKEAQEVYREYLLVSSGAAGSRGKVVLSREEIQKKLEKGKELGMNEVLRLRLRHLSEGMVLGSREYVEGVFAEFRDRFGARRRTGARKIRGLPLGSLMMSLRDLKQAVAG